MHTSQTQALGILATLLVHNKQCLLLLLMWAGC
jgi:hypothetical protein